MGDSLALKTVDRGHDCAAFKHVTTRAVDVNMQDLRVTSSGDLIDNVFGANTPERIYHVIDIERCFAPIAYEICGQTLAARVVTQELQNFHLVLRSLCADRRFLRR